MAPAATSADLLVSISQPDSLYVRINHMHIWSTYPTDNIRFCLELELRLLLVRLELPTVKWL